MAKTVIARIDDLLADKPGTKPLARGDPDTAAVAVLQDLLIGHCAHLPDIGDSDRGIFGPKTEASLQAFQAHQSLSASGQLDAKTLSVLVATPAPSPIAAQGYLELVLGILWAGFARVVGITAQFEAAGRFTALNRNSDRAGLSFGIIQWAQRPGRLDGLLRAFELAAPARFVDVFGGGDGAVASGLLTHTAKMKGGVDAYGRTTDPEFDLVNDAWSARFVEAGRDQTWQKGQVTEAITAFRESCKVIRACAPVGRSERAVAFLLDVANQHGNGGLQNICATCGAPGLSEAALLSAVQRESVRRLKAQFGDVSAEARATELRRETFRTTPMLSDAAFQDA